MVDKALEEKLLARLKAINMRIDWIASTEGRAALTRGFGANGEFFDEKMALVDRADKILDQLTDELNRKS
jgi:hypothetical protein